MDLKTADPIDIVNALREKLIVASGKLSKAEYERLIPRSLKKKDQHNIPHYVPGTLRRQREEAQKWLNDKGRPGFFRKPAVPQDVQEGYMNKFYEAKALGKFAHLPNDELVNLETEVRNTAADSTKHTELEEFLKSIEEEVVVPESEVNLKELLEPFEDIPEPENIDLVQAFSADEMPENFPRECPIDRVDSSLPVTEYVQPEELKVSLTPTRLRTISETLEALVIATEFAEQNNCNPFIDNLDSFIAHLSCLTVASQDQNCLSLEENHDLLNETSEVCDISNEQQNGPPLESSVTDSIPQSDSQIPFETSDPITTQAQNMPTNSSLDNNIVLDNGLPTKPAFLTETDFDSPLIENGLPLTEDEDVQIPPTPAAECVQHLVHRKMVMNNNKYNIKKNPRPILRSGTVH